MSELPPAAALPVIDVVPASVPEPTVDVTVVRARVRVAPTSAAPVAPPRRRSRARAIVAKVLFVTLFAGVATLLGFAVKKKLEASGHAPDWSSLVARFR